MAIYKGFSPKQAEIFNAWRLPKYRGSSIINIYGAVRVGKTWLASKAALLWAYETVKNTPDNERVRGYDCFIASAATSKLVYRNIYSSMIELLEALGFAKVDKESYLKRYKRAYFLKGGTSELHIQWDGEHLEFWTIDAKDIGSMVRVQGLTVRGGIVDEYPILNLEVVEMILTRNNTFTDGLWLMTANPTKKGKEDPAYKRFIENAIEKKYALIHMHYLDNPNFTQEDVEQARIEYTGNTFIQKIEGLWQKASGSVYPRFKPELHVSDIWKNFQQERYFKFALSYDIGNNDRTVYSLTGFKLQYQGVDLLHQKVIHDDQVKDQIDLRDMFYDWVRELLKTVNLPRNRIFRVYCESSADGVSFMRMLRNRLPRDLVGKVQFTSVNKQQKLNPTTGNIQSRVDVLNLMLNTNHIQVDSGCTEFISDVQAIGFDDKTGKREDNRLCDTLDSFEYSWMHELVNLEKAIAHINLRSQ
jgi:hypothetical protein